MKIMVFNGSPKRDESDTLHMTRAFLEGMEQLGFSRAQAIGLLEKEQSE